MKRMIAGIFLAAAVGLCAAPAMAANDFTATYDATTGAVTIGDYTSTGTVQTLVVLDEDCTTVTEDCVKQLKQQDGAFATVPVGSLEDGTYYVRIGGDTASTYLSASFTVGEPSTQLIGDVDDNGTINVTDASSIQNHVLENAILTGNALKAADADQNSVVNISDAAQVINYALNKASTIDGTSTIK